MGPTAKFSDVLGAEPQTSERVECPTHGPFEQFTMKLGGREVKTKCPTCQRELDAQRSREALAAAEQERATQRAKAAAERASEILSASQLPKRFIGKTFASFHADGEPQRAALAACREFAENFEQHLERGSGLLLSGAMGNGKTHLAGAIMQAIMPRRRSLFTTVPELIRAVRDTWRRDSKYSTTRVVDSMRALDLLVVDEVGVQTGTDGEQVILYDVLDGRYRDCKPTILITNLDSKALRVAVGDRLYDRLRETSKRVVFEWDSYRPQARAAQ